MKTLSTLFIIGFGVLGTAQGQVVFNDNFNGSNVTTNNGGGAVNPTSTTTVYQINQNSGAIGQNSGGAYFTPGGGYGHQDLASVTGNADNGYAYGLSANPTTFAITLNNVNVSGNGGGRGDIPNSGNGGFRFELGLVSANNTDSDPELFLNNSGGLYLNLFYDQQDNLTGDLRATDSSKNGYYDSAGGPGIYELASFNIPQPAGTTSSYIAPLTVSLSLTNASYAVTFSEAANVTSGSLIGAFTPLEQTDLSTGLRTSLYGQGFSNGDGSGNISNVEITAPEPSTYAMLGLGMAGLMFFARRKLA